MRKINWLMAFKWVFISPLALLIIVMMGLWMAGEMIVEVVRNDVYGESEG